MSLCRGDGSCEFGVDRVSVSQGQDRERREHRFQCDLPEVRLHVNVDFVDIEDLDTLRWKKACLRARC